MNSPRKGKVMKNKTLIICASYHHNNTKKICDALASELQATIIEPKDYHESMLNNYTLVGFGSGIYNRQHHKELMNLANIIASSEKRKAFVFSTSSLGLTSLHKNLNELLISKNFEIIGEFACRGFMNYSFTKLFFGGLNKGKPDETDLAKARDFARNLSVYCA
jgi:flavodoxin